VFAFCCLHVGFILMRPLFVPWLQRSGYCLHYVWFNLRFESIYVHFSLKTGWAILYRSYIVPIWFVYASFRAV